MAHAQFGAYLQRASESRCSQPRARQERGNCGSAPAIGKGSLSTSTTIGEVTGNLEKAFQTLELWVQTYPRRAAPPDPHGSLGGPFHQGTGRLERAIDAARKTIAAYPDVRIGYGNLARRAISCRPLRRSREHAPASRRAERNGWNCRTSWSTRYNIALMKGDKEQMDRAVASGQGQARGRTLGGSRGGSCSGSFRPAATGPASHPAGPWIWLARRGEREAAATYQAARRYGKPFTGMLPKRRRTPRRRWRFRTAGTSNTPRLLPWLFREIPLDRNRLPMISKSASRKIRSSNSLICPFFARYPRCTAGKPRTAWSGCKSLCPTNWR